MYLKWKEEDVVLGNTHIGRLGTMSRQCLTSAPMEQISVIA
jgi:hypothetical protein